MCINSFILTLADLRGGLWCRRNAHGLVRVRALVTYSILAMLIRRARTLACKAVPAAFFNILTALSDDQRADTIAALQSSHPHAFQSRIVSSSGLARRLLRHCMGSLRAAGAGRALVAERPQFVSRQWRSQG